MSEQEIEAVLATHRFMARNAAGRMGCHGCTWTSDLTPGTDRAWAEYAAHVAAALVPILAAREARAQTEGAREALVAGIARLDAEVASEVERLGGKERIHASGLLNNWIGGLRTAADVLRGWAECYRVDSAVERDTDG